MIRVVLPLIVIILIGVMLRVWQPEMCHVIKLTCSSDLTILPPSINWDEASLGYNAFSIIKTGRDEWGRLSPLSFEAFGDFKLPVYVYFLTPFVYFFGLNEYSVRMLSQVSGVVSLILIYLIAIKIFKSKLLAFVACLLLVFSPWHVFLSRIGVEASLGLTLFFAGLLFYLTGLERSKFLALAFIFWGLSIFTYNSARIFIPLFILLIAFLGRKQISRLGKKFFLSSMLFLVPLIVAGFMAVFYDSNARYSWIGILDQGAINQINQSRGLSSLPFPLPNLIDNKYSFFISHFLINYFQHFTPNFLAINGGSHYQFSIPNTGLIYFVELPFFYLGILLLLKRYKLKHFLLWWLILAPIPSAITRDSPHVLRSVFMLGGLQITTAFGFVNVYEKLSNFKSVRLMTVLLFGLGLATGSFLYLYNYIFTYPYKYSESWQYGMKQIYQNLNLLLERQGFEEKPIYISKKYGEPHIFYLFFTQYDPEKYYTNPTLVRYSRANWRWVDKIDNINFLDDENVITNTSRANQAILVTSKSNYPPGGKLIDTVNFLDGSRAFDIVEIGVNRRLN